MTQPEPPSAALTLAVLQEALAQARQARDHPVEQNIHLLLARELERVKQYEEALLAYAEASVLSLFTGDAVARLCALIGEGMLYLRERKAELARDKFTAGLALTREQGNYLDEAEVLNLLAQAHTQLAHFELGARLHHEGIELARAGNATAVEAGAPDRPGAPGGCRTRPARAGDDAPASGAGTVPGRLR